MRHIHSTAVAVAAGCAVALIAAAPAQAGGHGPSVPSTVASGLNNPRGLAFSSDGTLFVAEAGKGGAGPCQPGPEGGTVCFGTSSSITKVRHGHQYRIVTNLPSLASPAGEEAIGASDVSLGRDGLLFTVGLGGNPALRTQVPQLAGMAKLYRLSGKGPRAVADLGGYEQRVNPDGVTPPDTNPQALLATRGGTFAVDAGGNSLLRVDHGRISTVATFPQRTVPAPPGIPDLPPTLPLQAVPTSVVAGPDGALYVGELTGFPFPPGLARIWRIRPGHAPTVYASGFTNVIDIAFGPDGKLYVLEISKNGLLDPSTAGALIKIGRNGSTTELPVSLTAPGGLAIRGNSAYVSNCSVCPGTGTVLRIPLG